MPDGNRQCGKVNFKVVVFYSFIYNYYLKNVLAKGHHHFKFRAPASPFLTAVSVRHASIWEFCPLLRIVRAAANLEFFLSYMKTVLERREGK